ncbi:MAG TPA: acyl-CoA dehydrogenase family protein [Aggregatilineales bacterium]|nr:acyl-CoA dehydrogenase family protein [Aggregatilineales bacterium]
MTIEFEIPENLLQEQMMVHAVAEGIMRPYSRELDEAEHTRPTEFVRNMWPLLKERQARDLDKMHEQANGSGQKASNGKRSTKYLRLMLTIEGLSWGDVGQYLCMPMGGLATSAIESVGTIEQKERFLRRFAEGDAPAWGAMAMTEPGAGSDTSAIQTTASLDEDTNEWILNGEKIFCTSGGLALNESNGIVVVWATVDKKAGRSGMKPFVIEAGTPGVEVTKAELKHGIRSSDTVAIVFKNARIPYDNILGDPEVQKGEGTKGFKGAMKTFDASRPLVAASALGVGRAALDFVKDALKKEGIEITYDKPYHKQSAIEHDILKMEAQLKAAYMLTLRSISMLDEGESNRLEASICKAKAGKAVTWITQKAVEILGPLGYTRDILVEKWMRDGKINDIYEGTGQINLLIIARSILEYSSRELS